MISGFRCQVDETCELQDIMQHRVENPYKLSKFYFFTN